MQVKKIDIKQKIKQTATEMLFSTSYKDMSMRDVASRCDMTVGNIYRYYENKEILFDDIVSDAYSKVVNLIKITDFVKKFMKNKQSVNEKTVYKNTRFKTFILKQILKLVCDNATELYILVSSSEGSKYQNTELIIKNLIQDTIKKMVAEISNNEAETYAYVVVATASHLLKKHINNRAQLEQSLQKFCIKLFESF